MHTVVQREDTLTDYSNLERWRETIRDTSQEKTIETEIRLFYKGKETRINSHRNPVKSAWRTRMIIQRGDRIMVKDGDVT